MRNRTGRNLPISVQVRVCSRCDSEVKLKAKFTQDSDYRNSRVNNGIVSFIILPEEDANNTRPSPARAETTALLRAQTNPDLEEAVMS